MYKELVFLDHKNKDSDILDIQRFFQYRLPGNLEQSIQSRYFYLAVAPMLVVVAQELYFKITMKFIYQFVYIYNAITCDTFFYHHSSLWLTGSKKNIILFLDVPHGHQITRLNTCVQQNVNDVKVFVLLSHILCEYRQCQFKIQSFLIPTRFGIVNIEL